MKWGTGRYLGAYWHWHDQGDLLLWGISVGEYFFGVAKNLS